MKGGRENTKIKICGITRSEDALLAVELGAWAIGFVFYRKSSRAIEPRVARSIRDCLPKGLKTVGVFVDSPIDEIVEAVRVSGVDTVQLHGNERPDFCAELQRRLPEIKVIKALRVRDENDLGEIQVFQACEAVLLDAYVQGVAGGTGQTFDWAMASRLSPETTQRLIISGGLKPENVGIALSLFAPYALDVSSGVELRPGIKDEKRMRAFFAAVQEAAREIA